MDIRLTRAEAPTTRRRREGTSALVPSIEGETPKAARPLSSFFSPIQNRAPRAPLGTMGSAYFDHGGLHATPGGFNAHLTGHGTPLTGASGDGGARFTGGMTGEPRGDPQPYAPLLFTATPSSTLAAGGHGATPTGGHQTSATHPDGFGTAGYFTGGGTPGNVLTPNTGRGSFFGGATPGAFDAFRSFARPTPSNPSATRRQISTLIEPTRASRAQPRVDWTRRASSVRWIVVVVRAACDVE